MNTTKLILNGGLLLIASLVTAQAQTTTTTTSSATTYDRTGTTYETAPVAIVGPVARDFEFTLGGGGVSNKHLDDSSGSVNASIGYYLTDTTEVVFRQNTSYTNGNNGGANYDFASFIALDQHFWAHGRFRPFVGVNVGGFYGDNTSDTWAVGVEAGAKFYVQPKTFIFAIANYDWNFNSSSQLTNRSDDGTFQWGVGIGFNF